MWLRRWAGLAANLMPRSRRNPWISLTTAARRGYCFRLSMTYSLVRRSASCCPRFLTKTWYVTASQAL
jgi:hypothetical protein